MTPIEHLNRCRVDAAARMLAGAPNANVTQIALTHGFSTSQYFAKVFRNIKGCSPTEYRTQVGGGRKEV